MKPREFITAYENALATQDWKAVEPLMSDKVCVSFSNGTVHMGKAQVEKAFRQNFDTIKSERYVISKVVWVTVEQNYAVYLFDYEWSGLIKGQSVSGKGIGTATISKGKDNWTLMAEHLGHKK